MCVCVGLGVGASYTILLAAPSNTNDLLAREGSGVKDGEIPKSDRKREKDGRVSQTE